MNLLPPKLQSPNISLDIWWKEKERQFINIRSQIEAAYFLTPEQATSHNPPNIDSFGTTQLHPDVHPFRKSDDHEMLEYVLNAAHKLFPVFEHHFQVRQLTPSFCDAWGRLQYCHGYMQSIYFGTTDDMKEERGGKSSGKGRNRLAQQIWVSKMLKQKIDKGIHRQVAERELARHIKTLLNSNTLPYGFSEQWFRAILDKKGEQVNTSYDSKKGRLTEDDILAFAAIEHVVIPPTEW
jgi:hypothetical protein